MTKDLFQARRLAADLRPGDRYQMGWNVYVVSSVPDPGPPGPLVSSVSEEDGTRVLHSFGPNVYVRVEEKTDIRG